MGTVRPSFRDGTYSGMCQESMVVMYKGNPHAPGLIGHLMSTQESVMLLGSEPKTTIMFYLPCKMWTNAQRTTTTAAEVRSASMSLEGSTVYSPHVPRLSSTPAMLRLQPCKCPALCCVQPKEDLSATPTCCIGAGAPGKREALFLPAPPPFP